MFPDNYLIKSGKDRFLNRDIVQIHKIDKARTNSRMRLDATVEKIEKLEKTLNSTVTKVINLEISTILLKLSDEIDYLQNAIRWLKK